MDSFCPFRILSDPGAQNLMVVFSITVDFRESFQNEIIFSLIEIIYSYSLIIPLIPPFITKAGNTAGMHNNAEYAQNLFWYS